MEADHSQTTVAKMKNIGSATAVWMMEDWSAHHALLAAESSCVIEIGDISLRFFLNPIEKTLKTNNCTVRNGWYSLAVELVSEDEKASVEVQVTIVELGWKLRAETFLKKSPDNQKGIGVVYEEFLSFGSWYNKL